MHLITENGGPQNERKTLPANLTDWDAARIFLEVVRGGSFRSAAERLGLSINAVRRRVDDFERQIGTTLFTRDVQGARLTQEGTQVVAAVEQMEAAFFELLRASDAANALSGEVRVAVTEGLGTFWLAPRLIEFQQSFPNIMLDLQCAMRAADVSRYEADVAIHLSRPAVLDVKLVRLGRMHLLPFASQKYLETYGTPRTLSDMAKHRLVLQIPDEETAKRAEETMERIFSGSVEHPLMTIKTNISSTNYFAVANGAGIGILPTYACALGGALIPLDLDPHWSFDIWLSYHSTSGRITRVRQMIDWLIEAFNPAKYPWFRDDLIHPREFNAVVPAHP
jgi:DNA-binding transcriptional LysR family regulator